MEFRGFSLLQSQCSLKAELHACADEPTGLLSGVQTGGTMRPLRYGRNVVLSLLLMVPAMLVAQSQATTGTIEGNTFDQTGAVLPSATVTFRHRATGGERKLGGEEQ